MPVLALSSREPAEQLLGDERRQPERRFVEQQQLGSGHQRPGDGQHLLLAARQGPGLLPASLGQAREGIVPVVRSSRPASSLRV